MKTQLLFSTLSLWILLNTFAFSQGRPFTSQVWVGEGGQTTVYKHSATRTDGNGNVYVVGSTINTDHNSDIIIQKFDSNGNLLWQKTHNGNANKNDYGAALFVDNTGNVYVTGSTVFNVLDSSDLVVLKYNSNGVLQWTYRYNYDNTNLLPDAGTAIVGDNDGNIFVTGSSISSDQASDYVTIRLNANTGNVLWVKRYDYVALHDVASRIHVRGTNVVVTGGSQILSNSITWQLATLVYDVNTGDLAYIRRSNTNIIASIHEINDLSVDDAGHVYVTGTVFNQGTGKDIVVYKLNNLLQVVWEQNFDAHGLDDVGTQVKVDQQGNVYVAGTVGNPREGRNYILLKYNSLGALQWKREINGLASQDDEATALAIDNSGKIFITGTTRNNADADYQTLGYQPNGEIFTHISYDAYGLDDKPTDITIDAQNNIIVVG